MTISLKTTRTLQGVSGIILWQFAAFFAMITLTVFVVAAVAVGDVLVGFVAIAGATSIIVLPCVICPRLAYVRIEVVPGGIYVERQWIPRRELIGCEIEDEGGHTVRLLIRSTQGVWRSPPLDESRSKLTFIAAAVMLPRQFDHPP